MRRTLVLAVVILAAALSAWGRASTVTVISPAGDTIARPHLAIVATCVDANLSPCELSALLREGSLDPEVVLATSTSGKLNVVVDVSAHAAKTQIATVFLVLVGTDSAGRKTEKYAANLKVEGSAGLQEDSVVPASSIYDVDADRILYLAGGALAVRNRASGVDEVIFADARPSGFVALTAAGAAIRQGEFPVVDPAPLISIEAGNVPHDLGPVQFHAPAVRAGRYLAWMGSGLNAYRRDVMSGSTVQIATGGSPHTARPMDVASNGAAVVSESNGGKLVLYQLDGSSRILPTVPGELGAGWRARTDGDGVLFSTGGRLLLDRGGASQDLGPAVQEYDIENGWVGYEKPDSNGVSHVWRMDASGATVPITTGSDPGYFMAVAADGSVAFRRTTRGGLRYFSSGAAPGTPVEFGRVGVARMVGNVPYVDIFGSLFSVNTAPLRPSPAALAFASHAIGTSTVRSFTFTNTGATPVTVGPVATTGDFAVSSNGCTTVAPGATCGIGIAFTPTAKGPRNGTLTVGGSGAQQVRQLKGIGAEVGRLANISTRGPVNRGDSVMIGGFIIGGTAPKTVLVRARGPSLAQFGVPGVLPDPQVQLYSGQTPIAFNDNWGDAPNKLDIQATGFAPEDPKEAVILTTLAPGGYTAIVTGAGNTVGTGIVEVFEVGEATMGLHNISTRGHVLTGDSVLIGGLVIQGDEPQTVVIRARGPSLSQFGVPGVMENPQLQLYSGQTPIAFNDNWGDAPNKAAIAASMLAPENPNESAILVTLQPGAYTAIVTGVGGSTGIGIVEVFRTQ